MINNYTTLNSGATTGFKNSLKEKFFLLLILVLFSALGVQAQVTVTGDGAGSYSDLQTALGALPATLTQNTVVDLAASNPQTAPAGGYSITTTGTASFSLVIQGNGNTITASNAHTVGSLSDAIFKIIGGDYITLQGFVMAENGANTITVAASNTMTEWGVALLYASTTDGAKNNTIQNNTISLNRSYSNTFGIYSSVRHTATTPTTAADITLATGSNSNNKIYSNIINNVDKGIVFIGSAAAAAMDTGNDIGGASLSTANTITNWGGLVSGTMSAYVVVTAGSYCILMNCQVGDNVSFNTISSAGITTLPALALSGIIKSQSNQPTGLTFTSNYNSNAITLTNNAATTSQTTALQMIGLTTLATATYNCNNNIVTCNLNGSVTGALMIGILTSSAPGTLNITGNTIRGFSSTTTSTGSFIGITQQSNGVVTALNINNNKIGDATAGAMTFNNTTTTATVTGISVTATGAAATCALSISGNDFRGITYVTSGTGAHTYISNAATCSTTINSNTFTNLNVNTTGAITFISNNSIKAASTTQTVNNNAIVGTFNKGGTGGTILFYNSTLTSPSSVTEVNSGNNFSNLTFTGAAITGWRITDGAVAAGSRKTITNNVFNNITNNTSGNISSILWVGNSDNTFASNNVSGNTISNITGAGTVIGLLSDTQNHNFFNNTIFGLSSSGAAAVTGISLTGGNVVNVYKNKIYNLSGSNAASTVNGILIAGGTTFSVYNNAIGDLRATTANAANPVVGINITGGTTANVYYNTVYLAAVSSGAVFGSSAISVATVTALTMRNNIFVNNSTSNTTGLTVAYRRSSTTISTYNAASDRNDFYAPNIYTDGTNTFTAFGPGAGTYLNFVSTRDANSISLNPTFSSTTSGNANFLKIDPAVSSKIESGGANIAGITDDIDGTVRFGNPGYATQTNGGGYSTDLGAYEYDGLPFGLCAGTPAASTVNGGSNFCPGLGTTLSLSGTYTDVGISYQWRSSTTPGGPYSTYLGTAITQATGNLSVSTYYVCDIICSFSGLTYTTAEKAVLVYTAPTVTLTKSAEGICNPGGSPITLTAGGAVSYTYTNNTSLTPTSGSLVSANPSSSTTYVVTGTDGNGCTNTASATVVVAGPITTGIGTLSATPNTICAGGSSQLLVVPPPPTTSAATMAFTSSTGNTLETIISPTTVNTLAGLTSGSLDDGAILVSPSFTFPYLGTNYTSFGVGTNGYLLFGTSSTSIPSSITSIGSLNGVYGFGRDQNLNINNAGDLTHGTAAGGKYVFQLTNNAGGGSGAESAINFATIQFVLWGSSSADPGRIDIIYGANTGTPASAGAIGLTDSAGTFRNAVNGSTSSTATSATWPVSGQMYSFSKVSSLTYTWSPAGLLNNASIANPLASNIPATMDFTATASNGACTASANVTVNISSGASIQTDPTDTAKCAGETATFTVAATGPALTYVWKRGTTTLTDGGTISGATTATLTITGVVSGDAGNYTVVVTSGCGSPQTSAAAVLTVNPTPVTTGTTSNSPICSNQTLQLTGVTTAGTTFSWTGPNSFSSTEQSPAILNASAAAAGNYTFTATANGCASAPIQIAVVVNTSPTALTISPATSSICSGTSVNLDVIGGSIAGTLNKDSGVISVAIPDNNPAGINNALTVAGIPNGAVTNVAVTFSITHGFDQDVIVSLEAPNGKIINLVNGSSGRTGTNFTNTVISSSSTTAIPSAAGPYTGTFKADAATSGFQLAPTQLPNTALFSDLFSNPNGDWKIRVYDDESIGAGTLTNWKLDITYNAPATITWTPASSGLNVYTGASVIASPTSDITYTATASLNGCETFNTASVTVKPLPIYTVTTPVSICNGSPASLTVNTLQSNSYAWTLTGNATVLGTTNPFSVSPTTNTVYDVTVTNNNTNCSATSQVAVNVTDNGSIVTEPESSIAAFNFGTTFTVAGSPSVTYTYQWQVNNGSGYSNVAGAQYAGTGTSATLTVNNAGSGSAFNNALYRCILTPPSPCGVLTSTGALLTVSTTGIALGPQNVSYCLPPAPTSTQFSVVTTGDDPFEVDWSFSTNGIAPYTAISLWDVENELYLGPVTIGGLTFSHDVIDIDANQYNLKVLTITGVNSSSYNGYKFKALLNGALATTIATLAVSDQVTFTNNLSTTEVKRCKNPAPGTATTLSVTTSGNVGSVVWKVAATAGAADNAYTTVANVTGISYATSTVGNVYSLDVTTTSAATAGSYYYKAFVTGTGVCANVASNEAKITVVNPTVTITAPTTASCSGAAVSLTAVAGLSGYSWSSSPGTFSDSTNAISVTPTVPTTYTVVGTDSNGCTNTASQLITLGSNFNATASATPLTICSGGNAQLTSAGTAIVPVEAAIKITEVTLFRTGTGASTYPAFVVGQDLVEITNVSGNPVDVSGWTLSDHASNSATVSHAGFAFPGGTTIPANSVAVVCLGAGTDDTPNLYFNTGGTSDSWSSGSLVGIVLKNGSTVMDAVGCGSGYVFNAGTDVTAGDWSGFAPSASGLAGTTRIVPIDNNAGSDWSASSTTTQTVGVYNAGFTTPLTIVSYAWSPATFLSATNIANPVATGVTSTTNYTVTLTSSTGCTATANATAAIIGLTGQAATVTATRCAGNNFTVTANKANGGGPFNYAWADGVGTVYPNAASITANLPAGTYNFVCTITDACGSNVTSSISNVVVNAKPTVSISASNSSKICGTSNTVTLTASGSPTSYTWSPTTALIPADGLSAVEVSAATNTTTYTVTTATDANGCFNTASSTVTVLAFPINVTASASPASICPNTTTTLTGTGTLPSALVNTYAFATSTGATLDPMVGATQLLTTSNDDTPTASATTFGGGFAFNFNGVSYTQYSVSPDGWILFGPTAAANEFTNAVTSSANTPKIYPYWDDLATGTNGNVTSLMTGTAPNRIFKVQWFVNIPRNTTGPANSTFQAWLYEGSNKIEYRYGTMGTPSSGTISAGMTGNASTFQSITYSSNSASTAAANDVNTTAPASGRLYSFTPPAPVLTYAWTAATNLVSPSTLITATNALSSNETFTLTVSNSGCNTTAQTTVSMKALVALTSATSGASTICSNATTTLSYTGLSGPGATVSWWSNPNGTGTQYGTSSTTANGTSSVFVGPGTYYAYATGDCGTAVSRQVVVVGQPLPASAGLNGSLSICSNVTLTTTLLFNALTGSPAAGGTWSPTLAGAGTYTYTQAATSPCTVSNTAQVVVTLIPTNTPTVLLTSSDGDNTFAYGTTVTFTASGATLGGSTVTNYNFKVNGSSVQSGISNTYVVNNLADNDQVSVDITVTGGTCLTSTTATSSTIINTVTGAYLSFITTYCGQTLPFINSLISCSTPHGIIGTLAYRFKVKNNITGTTVTLDSSVPNFKLTATNVYAYNTTFNVQVAPLVNGVEQPYSAVCVIATGGIPLNQVGPCTQTLTLLNDRIYAANTLFGSQLYRFRVAESTAPSTYYYTTSIGPNFRLANVPGLPLNFGKTYFVSVQSDLMNNGIAVTTPYDAPCTVNTPAVTAVSVLANQCGQQLVTILDKIFINVVPNAVGYNYRVKKGATGQEYTFNSTFTNFRLSNVVGLSLTYETDYYVSVQSIIRIDGIDYLSNFSTPCIITTPNFPTVSVQESQCSDGNQENPGPYLVPSTSTLIYAEFVSGATYEFQLQEYDGENPVGLPLTSLIRPTNNFTLHQVTGVQPNTVYLVSVVLTSYGQGPIGHACVIKSPAAAREIATVANGKVEFSAMAYPNPFANNFVIDVKSRSEAVVELKVYDMIGRLVEQRSVGISDLVNSPIGDRYPSGVYNVIVTQGDEVRTVRVVKR